MPSRNLLVALIAATITPAQAQPIRVLIIDGINNHDWQAGTQLMRAVLKTQARFTVDVSTTPSKDASPADWKTWRPKFSQYDVVINNFNGGHLDDGVTWPEEVQRSLEDYVRGGGGLVVFHAANNAFLHWQA